MKKLFLLLLCLIMTAALLLTACSPADPGPTGDGDGNENGGNENGSNQGGDQGGDQGGNQGGDQGGDQGGNQGGDQGGSQGGNQGGNQGDEDVTLPLSYYTAFATEMNQTSRVLHITDLSINVNGSGITLNIADLGVYFDANNKLVAYGGISMEADFNGDPTDTEEPYAYAIITDGILYAEMLQYNGTNERTVYLMLPLDTLSVDGVGLGVILDEVAAMLIEAENNSAAVIQESAQTYKQLMELLFTAAKTEGGYVHTLSLDILKQLNNHLYTNTIAQIINASMGPDTYESLDELAIEILGLTFADVEGLLTELGTDLETLAPEVAPIVSKIFGQAITAEDILLMFEEYAELPFLSMVIKEDNLEQMKSEIPTLLATYGNMTLYEIISETSETSEASEITPEGILAEVNGVIDELAQTITVTVETNNAGSEVVCTVTLNIPEQLSITLAIRLESDETSEDECRAMAENVKTLSKDLELTEGAVAYMFDDAGEVKEIPATDLLDIIFGDPQSSTGTPNGTTGNAA